MYCGNKGNPLQATHWLVRNTHEGQQTACNPCWSNRPHCSDCGDVSEGEHEGGRCSSCWGVYRGS
jgi:hypothetical protein